MVVGRSNRSDHRPILLANTIRNRGPKSFKFFDCWLTNLELTSLISLKWQSLGSMDISGKLKEVKRSMKVWNKEVNGNINQRIEDLEKKQYSKMRWEQMNF